MTDRIDRATRSRNMAAIRGRDTRPEIAVRSYLHRAGIRFRLHCKDLPGRPDIVLPRYRTVVFVHGCFWHRHRDCANSVLPATNREFWREKLDGNVARDERNVHALRDLGWNVIVVWECQTDEASLAMLANRLKGTPAR
jgi:DNA mismatch endonuclease (patch repair protein)